MEGETIPVPQIVFRDISETDYLKLFSENKGNIIAGALTDISVFEGRDYSNLFRKNNRSGAGVFSFLSSLAKKSFPFLRKYVLPEAVNFGTSLIEKSRKDPSKPLNREDIKKLGKTSLKNITKRVLESGGKRRKRLNKRKGDKKIKKKKTRKT